MPCERVQEKQLRLAVLQQVGWAVMKTMAAVAVAEKTSSPPLVESGSWRCHSRQGTAVRKEPGSLRLVEDRQKRWMRSVASPPQRV